MKVIFFLSSSYFQFKSHTLAHSHRIAGVEIFFVDLNLGCSSQGWILLLSARYPRPLLYESVKTVFRQEYCKSFSLWARNYPYLPLLTPYKMWYYVFYSFLKKKKFLEYLYENFFQKLWKYIYHFPQPSLDILDQNLAYISRDKPIRVRRPWAPPVKLGGKQADQYWYCGQEANSGQVHFWLHCSKYSWLSF